MPEEKTLVERSEFRAIPDVRAHIEQRISVVIHCFDGEVQPGGDFLYGESICDAVQDLYLAGRNFLDESVTTVTFLCVHPGFSALLGGLSGEKRL